jgi:hypothetical protein
MTVETAQLAVECAEAQLATAREVLIEAIVAEAGHNPRAMLTVSFRELFRVLTGKPSVHFTAGTVRPRLVDPMLVAGRF